MSENMIELTDLMDDAMTTAVVPVDQVAATIRKWYPANDGDIRPSDLVNIDQFQAALEAEDYDEASQIASEIAVGFYHVLPADH